jgi:hypothetical protein
LHRGITVARYHLNGEEGRKHSQTETSWTKEFCNSEKIKEEKNQSTKRKGKNVKKWKWQEAEKNKNETKDEMRWEFSIVNLSFWMPAANNGTILFNLLSLHSLLERKSKNLLLRFMGNWMKWMVLRYNLKKHQIRKYLKIFKLS